MKGDMEKLNMSKLLTLVILSITYQTSFVLVQSFANTSPPSFTTFNKRIRSRNLGSSHLYQSSSTTEPSASSSKSKTSDLSSSKKKKDVKSSSTMTSTQQKQRNIFQRSTYDRPIVLLGSSSSKENNEVVRLAESLLDKLNACPSSSTGHVGSIIQVRSNHPDIKMQKKDILHAIQESKQFQFPDIIVLDFLNDDDVNDETSSSTTSTSHYSEIAKLLYEDANLLSIYINVKPTTSSSTTETVTSSLSPSSSQFEEDVLVKYSDYELCVKDEGIMTTATEENKRNNNNNDDKKKDDDDDDDDDIHTSNTSWDHITWELSRLVARAMLQPAIPGDTNADINCPQKIIGGLHTFFLSLSFPDITQVKPYIPNMCLDTDAMEYRTDLLECRDCRFDLIYGQQLVRYYCKDHAIRAPVLPFLGDVIDDSMPIVYTVRTKDQAGTYPNDKEGIAKMFTLLQWGLRSGVDVLDVESAWDKDVTSNLLDKAEERYATQILGSEHVVPNQVSMDKAISLFDQCAIGGRAHGAKVVLSIDEEKDDRMAYEASITNQKNAAAEGKPVIPALNLILGDVGKYSRVLNQVILPVTHESLPFKAAPGQMTAKEVMDTRILTGIIKPKQYCILGHNIAYSVSPQMHNGAFNATKLPHIYKRADYETVEEFVCSDIFTAKNFGGCSITIPHKQNIIPYVDIMSESATIIGSVNTLIVKEDDVDDDTPSENKDNSKKRIIYGDNTDWKGIYNPLERKLGGSFARNEDEDEDDTTSTSAGKSKPCTLIIGAGGTARAAAYASQKLGLEIIYYNRTPSKAKDLVDSFGGFVVTNLDSSGSNDDDSCLGSVLNKMNGQIKVVISTVPAGAEFTLPEWIFKKSSNGGDESNSLPIIFDVNYKPYYTKLLEQSESYGCQVVRGSEMLWEQGVGQFELWTGRTAPYRVMKNIVLSNCLPKKDS